ncbi:hypothetical protein [Komagataeibacter diospyri]|nr:hypothetical protein [Komagataeibacter diospyri]
MAYSASKAGISGLTKVLAFEWWRVGGDGQRHLARCG